VADPVLAAAATPAPDAVASGDAETAGRIEMTAAQQYTLKTVMAALKPAIDIAKASAAAVAAAAAARAAAEDGTEPAAAAPPLNTDANEAIEFALAVISDIDIADPALHSVVEDASVSAGEKLIRIDTLVSRYNTYLTNTYMDPQFMSAAVVQL
jgi:hypothetical protein